MVYNLSLYFCFQWMICINVLCPLPTIMRSQGSTVMDACTVHILYMYIWCSMVYVVKAASYMHTMYVFGDSTMILELIFLVMYVISYKPCRIEDRQFGVYNS